MVTASSDPVGDDGLLSVLLVPLPDPDADPEDADQVTRRLRAEIADVDWDSMEIVPGPAAPERAKGDPITIGAIVLGLGASGGVLPALVDTIRDWLGRQKGRHRVAITIAGDTIELDAATSAQQRQLVQAFVRRHSGQ